jgi:DNA-binding CsgD family transcriptional regulator
VTWPQPFAGVAPHGGGVVRLSRARVVAQVLAQSAPIIVIDAPAGMGKTWFLKDLELSAPKGMRLVDLPHQPIAAALQNPEPGTQVVIAKRPGTAVPGLARAEVYGQVARLPAEVLFFTPDELAGLSDDRTVFTRTGGWPCLIPIAMSEAAGTGAVAEFLREEVLAPLASNRLVAFAAWLNDPGAPADGNLLTGLPLITSGETLCPALAAVRWPMQKAIRAILQDRRADVLEARAIAVAEAALGDAPAAIATFQSIGEWQAAVQTLRAADGPFFTHRFGPEAFDRMLAGFPHDQLKTDETLVLCRAIQAIKRGEVRLTRQILADRFGPQAMDAQAVMAERTKNSLQYRFFRLLLRTWEDFGLDERFLEDAYRLLAELPATDDLRRGSFYNAVLELYIRARRFPEADHAASRAAGHYARAGIPILSFYVDLHRAIIRLSQGHPAQARAHAIAARGHLDRCQYDSPGDARLIQVIEACIAYETGQGDGLTRFLALELDAFAQGEIWPSLIEMMLIYGSQAQAEGYSTMAARSFLDRWRVTQDLSSQFRALIDIREVVILQSGNRWAEAATRAAAIPSRMTLAHVQGAEAELPLLMDRDDTALALVWLRHMAQVTPQRAGLDQLITAMLGNYNLTARQRIGAEIWLAHVLARQEKKSEAISRLARVLADAALAGLVAPVAEERSFLLPVLATRRMRDALEAVEPVRRLLRQIQESGPVRLAAGRAAGLTRQETRILNALAEGAGNKSIANMLGLSEATVKFHLANLYRKLGCGTRRDAVKAAAALRLVS